MAKIARLVINMSSWETDRFVRNNIKNESSFLISAGLTMQT